MTIFSFLLQCLLFCHSIHVAKNGAAAAFTASPLQRFLGVETGFASAMASSKDADGGDNPFQELTEWDSDVDYDKEWSKNEESISLEGGIQPSEWLDEAISSEEQLGIPILLDPMTEEVTQEIMDDARLMIEEEVQKGIKDLERFREKMNRELIKKQEQLTFRSKINMERESAKLMSKIDKMTSELLESTKEMRESTKRAAAADRNMEGKMLEWGSWGVLDSGVQVLMDPSLGKKRASGLLGSVDNAIQLQQQQLRKEESGETEEAGSSSTSTAENKVLILADDREDPIAKKLIPVFTDMLQTAFGSTPTEVEVVKPTATMPMGGNNAACLILFATSLTQPPKQALDRILRRTLLPNGAVGTPPTQLVCVSTVGTERTEKFPYSMQNLMGGRKLETRRQIEEFIISSVQKRVIEPPLDYTICKLGEIKDGSKMADWAIMPGDVLDEAVSIDLAAAALVEAVAFQPAARNATFCLSGGVDDVSLVAEARWDDEFLKLDGPELKRISQDELMDGRSIEPSAMQARFTQLLEYIQEWGEYFAESGKGLTTPIRAEMSSDRVYPPISTIVKRGGVRFLFLPTNTGTNYLSKEEELEKERRGQSSEPIRPKKEKYGEGGVEIILEMISDDAKTEGTEKKNEELRIRVRRCNMLDTTVVKALSEETILSRLDDAIAVWKKEHR